MPGKNYTTMQLEGGDYVKLTPVAAFLIERVQSGIPLPRVPVFVDESGNEYENPTDPEYLRQVQDVEMRRSGLTVTAAVFFGASLCDSKGDPIDPPDTGWEEMLSYVGVDWRKPLGDEVKTAAVLDEKVLREKSYLLYVAMTADDAAKMMPYLISTSGGYGAAVSTFQGEPARPADSRVRPKRK